MSTRIVVSCDGSFDDGRMPCRGAYPTGAATAGHARVKAMRDGWWVSLDGQDLCPAHARIHNLGMSGGTA